MKESIGEDKANSPEAQGIELSKEERSVSRRLDAAWINVASPARPDRDSIPAR
jgi:hypothetical protein